MQKMPAASIMIAFALPMLKGTPFAAGSNTYGLPLYLDQATYTINDYLSPTSDLSRSHADGEQFSVQLKSKLNAKHPSVRVLRSVNLKDAQVTWSNYVSSSQSSNEMVFFCGHGTSSGIYAQDNKTVYPSDKSYGGWTRWMFSSACLNLRNKDVNHYAPMFGGMHGFFGYESLSWEYIKAYSCNPFGCNHYRSEDVWKYFADNWVNKDMFMYDAWVKAVEATIYNQGRLGVAPGAVYVYGTVNDRGFIGGCEKPVNVFNGDVNWASLSKTHRYEVYGTPSY